MARGAVVSRPVVELLDATPAETAACRHSIVVAAEHLRGIVLFVRTENSFNDFGLFIAYVLPGLVAILGVGHYVRLPIAWLSIGSDGEPTIAGVISLTVAATAVGLTLSTVRWMLIDTVHHATGLRPAACDFGKLGDREAAFARLVDVHYRYYQFYANTFVAGVLLLFVRHLAGGNVWHAIDRWDLCLTAFLAVFFAASRDSLGRYYSRIGQLLRQQPAEKSKRT